MLVASFFNDHAVLFALVCAGIAIGYGLYLTYWLLSQPAGSERMQEIARAVLPDVHPAAAAPDEPAGDGPTIDDRSGVPSRRERPRTSASSTPRSPSSQSSRSSFSASTRSSVGAPPSAF